MIIYFNYEIYLNLSRSFFNKQKSTQYKNKSYFKFISDLFFVMSAFIFVIFKLIIYDKKLAL